MKKILMVSIVVPVVLLIFGCYPSDKLSLKYALFHLDGISSEFDDYNMAAPPSFDFENVVYFSTNRGSNGDNFDIWKGSVNFRASIDFSGPYDYIPEVSSAVEGPFYSTSEINTEFDEYGPIWLSDSLLLFASDRNGKLDIYVYDSSSDTVAEFGGNDPLFNDAYPTYDFENHRLYFCSDRGGSVFDIYYIDNTSDVLSKEWLTSTKDPADIIKAESLSSTGNDKCPYIVGNYIVFTSDRAGGLGGYDIWYSTRTGEDWLTPVNINNVIKYKNAWGDFEYVDLINTDANEYRPTLYHQQKRNQFSGVSDNKILIFSTNRSRFKESYNRNSKGGFDLCLAIMPENF